MRYAYRTLVLFFIMGFSVGCSYAQSADSSDASSGDTSTGTRVIHIMPIKNDANYLNMDVIVKGTIGARVTTDLKSQPRAFNITDDWGDSIMVAGRPDLDYPVKGETYLITGRVAQVSPNPPYLVETDRERFTGTVVKEDDNGTTLTVSVPAPAAVAAAPPEAPPMPLYLVILIAATGVVLIVLLVVLVFALRTPSSQPQQPAQDANLMEGTTIKINVPSKEAIQQKTIKVLPGRLEVLEGEDKIPDIKLFQADDNPGREYTIGRVNNGARMPINHIGFKTQTVSASQGKIIVAPDGRYTIFNFVDPVEKNPIVVAGKRLDKGESQALRDGDEVEIGTVKMRYHAS